MEYLIILFVVLSVVALGGCQLKEASACHSTQLQTCDFFELQCEEASTIRLVSLNYGIKDNYCQLTEKHCLNPNRDGCCVYEPDDCTQGYNRLHTYNLIRDCSSYKDCGPQQAPFSFLSHCNGNLSSYVRIQYDCYKNADSINMCDDQQTPGKAEMSIYFDNWNNIPFNQPTSCTCETRVLDGQEVEVDYVDIRMIQSESVSGTGSKCSSAVLRGEPNSNSSFTCDKSLSQEDNLVYNVPVKVPLEADGSKLRIILDNLYLNGDDDAPVMVWIHLRAISGTLVTRCFSEPMPTTTISSLTPSSSPGSPVTGSVNNTGNPLDRGGEDGNTAVIVGILIPILVVAILGAVLFFIWRRRQRPLKRMPAVQNSYTASIGSRSSTAITNTEYDEIGLVADGQRPSSIHCEYQLAKEPPHGYANTTENHAENPNNNHHTYQNIKGNIQDSNLDQNSKQEKKHSKFGGFTQAKDQLFSFFKKRDDNLTVPNIEKKPSNGSVTSYDHLNVNQPDIKLQVSPPPDDDDKHCYARTATNISTEPKKHTVNTNRAPSPKGVKAVEVGDSYIEFQFGTIDETEPSLLTSQSKTNDTKLTKPNRPPPKPASPKQGKLTVPASGSKTDSEVEISSEEVIEQQTYDYADADDNPSVSDHNVIASKQKHEVTNSQNSSAMDYSYADCDNEGNQNTDTLSADLVYEDIDQGTLTGIKKSHSSQDIRSDYSGEYEVPVKSSVRPASQPVTTHIKSKSAITGIENIAKDIAAPVGLGNVVKELKEIQDLPDLSDPSTLPDALKYSNLGLHNPKSRQKVEQKERKTETFSDDGPQNVWKSSQEMAKQSSKSSISDEPTKKKGVLSIARKFEGHL